jgi:hypothetical protein
MQLVLTFIVTFPSQSNKYRVITLIRSRPSPLPIITPFVWYTENVVKQNIGQGDNIIHFWDYVKRCRFVVCVYSHLSGFIKIHVVLGACSQLRWQKTPSEVLWLLNPLSLPAGVCGTGCSKFINAGIRIISKTPPKNHRELTFPFKEHSKALLSNVSAWSYTHCEKLRICVEEQYGLCYTDC